jgi:hypothetical protein
MENKTQLETDFVQIQEIIRSIKNSQIYQIPKEFLDEKVFSMVIDQEGHTILHLCAKYSYEKSFSGLPENLKQEKYLLLKNKFGETVIHTLISNNNNDEIPEGILFKNLDNTDFNGNTLLHKLGLSRFPTPPEWLNSKLLEQQNIHGDTPLHLFSEYQTHNIPPFVTRAQMLIKNSQHRSTLETIFQKHNIEALNPEVLAKLKSEDLEACNKKYREYYSSSKIKKLHTDAISYTIKKQLTKKSSDKQIGY